MAQTFNLFDQDSDINEIDTLLNENFETLQTLFAGATAPIAPKAYQWWADTGNNQLMQRDSTNSLWTFIMDLDVSGGGNVARAGDTMTGILGLGGNVMSGVGTATAASHALNFSQFLTYPKIVTRDTPIALATASYIVRRAESLETIQKVGILSSIATAGSNVGNNYTFQLRNVTQAVDLLSAVQTTNGAEIAADTPYDIIPDQNQDIAVDDVIRLDVVLTGAPTDISAADTLLQTEYIGRI